LTKLWNRIQTKYLNYRIIEDGNFTIGKLSELAGINLYTILQFHERRKAIIKILCQRESGNEVEIWGGEEDFKGSRRYAKITGRIIKVLLGWGSLAGLIDIALQIEWLAFKVRLIGVLIGKVKRKIEG
jgi:hypothetical protein